MPTAQRGTRRIHYTSSGEGPAVVLVPGIGSGSKLFGTLPRRFEKAGFQCLRFDPVGIAPSSAHDGAFDFEEAGKDLLAVTEDAGLADFDLVGTSLGGKVSLVAAGLAPKRIRRLVLLAASAISTPRSKRIYRFFEILARRLQASELAEAMAAFLFGYSFHNKHPQVVADILRSMQLDEASRSLMAAQAHSLQTFDEGSTAARLTCPALCIAGSEDTLTDQDEIITTAQAFPNGEFRLISGAGHSLLLEAPEALTLVLGFLQPNAAPQAP
jgi:pimeloyl-ACP methyl ester carboxylesterase